MNQNTQTFMYKKILFALLLFPVSLPAQDIILYDATSIGIGSILSLAPDELHAPANPAYAATLESTDVQFDYAVPFQLIELSQSRLSLTVPTMLVNITGQVQRSGDEQSNYLICGGGLSRSFAFFGIGAEYYAIIHTLDDNERYASSFSKVGAYFRPTNKWRIACMVHNIERAAIDYELSTYEIPTIACLAISWRGSDLFSFFLEAEKDFNYDPEGKVGVALYPIKNLVVSAGYYTSGSSISAAVRYSIFGFRMGAAIQHHVDLGISSAATVGFSF